MEHRKTIIEVIDTIMKQWHACPQAFAVYALFGSHLRSSVTCGAVSPLRGTTLSARTLNAAPAL